MPSLAEADTALSPMPFVSLDRAAGDSAAQLEVRGPVLANGDADTGFLIAADVSARYVDPGTHLGGYLNLPLNYFSNFGTDDDGNTTSKTVAGGFELGAIYAAQLPIPEVAIIAHAGIVLPSSSTDNAFPNVVAALITRPRDVYTALPGFTLRLGVSPIVRSGIWFARADINLDINLTDREDDSGDAEPVLTLAGGIGAQLPAVALTGEVTATHIFVSDDDANDSDPSSTLYTATVSARYTAGRVHPYLAVMLPLDHDARELSDVTFIGGIAFAL